MFRELSPARAIPAPPDVIVADQPIAGLSWRDYGTLIEEMTGGAQTPPNRIRLRGAEPAGSRRAGVREYLNESEGEGYWDYFRLSDHLSVSITDATYRKDRWISVEGGRFFKIRLLLSGRLLDQDGEVMLQGPQAHLHVCVDEPGGGYFIASGEPATMVVLHCAPEFLTQRLGLSLDEAPTPLSTLSEKAASAMSQRVAFGPELLRAAQWIVSSRYAALPSVRTAHLEALAQEVVCQLVTDLSGQSANPDTSGLSTRDIAAIYEARDYLSQHYAAPPTIPHLARMVAVNQTKLKAGFRQLLGVTVYEFILKRRMEAAAEMLAARDMSVAEVAYQVGYEYPGNFSCAFKRYYGRGPKAWKRA